MADAKLATWAEKRLGRGDDASFPLPDKEYPFAAEVPKGGAACSKCKYGSDGACSNRYFIDYRKRTANDGSGKLPKPADEYCCNAFTAS